jgi:MinD-like ATPase involved in chromosome partitioning or flagellar assembly
MALIVIAADKGAPGVTTTALALAAVWPRRVLLAECDPSGGDLVYRFPADQGNSLDPRRGLLTLAVAARRGLQPGQLWEHTQKMVGGLDVLTGVINAEQGAGLATLWGPLGGLFAGMSGGDVIADCGRLGADGPQYDLIAQAAVVLLVTRPTPGDIIRLRDRAAAVASAVNARGRRGFTSAVAVIADQRTLKATAAEVSHTLTQGNVPAGTVGGLANDPKGAELLRGEWGGRLDKTLLIRTARETAQQLAASLPAVGDDDGGPTSAPPPARGQSARTQSVQPPHPPAAQPQYPPGPGSQAAPQYPPGPGPQAAPQYPPGPGPQAPPQHPPRQQQRGAGGRHSSLAQPAGAAEAGDGRWTTP